MKKSMKVTDPENLADRVFIEADTTEQELRMLQQLGKKNVDEMKYLGLSIDTDILRTFIY